LGEGEQHIERQSPHDGRRIEGLGDRDERDPLRIEGLDDLGKVGKRPGQAIDLIDDNRIYEACICLTSAPMGQFIMIA
jgi:hypothetical protein